MLHLLCSARFGEALKVKLKPTPNESELDWLDCWYVRDIPVGSPFDAFLFTNKASNYSLILPFVGRENPNEVVVMFQQRLAWLLGQPVPTYTATYNLCKEAHPRDVGSMNVEMQSWLYKVERKLSGDGVQFEKIEEYLNSRISGGSFPRAEFEKRIQNAQSKLLPTQYPYLKIVDN